LIRFYEGVHHIIVQGIERKEIFQDDWDREDLLARPERSCRREIQGALPSSDIRRALYPVRKPSHSWRG
jgi:hypothetical protein